ncbi:hypothetical protein CVT25_008874 [Psilocybe cyanescens]|uniref:Secreted protein n=1 Tax=Psilocybe cyanescens TaxID=93625 RepID=A0A409VRK5_PSICY|nr:hypothetical protein CVT25_008874 [Psilocybe cyanescens]
MSVFLLCCLVASVVASPLDFHADSSQVALTQVQSEKTSEIGWYDPRLNGGRLLDYTSKKYGEPLNVIISGLSDPFVLTDAGFFFYTRSLGYSEECLGLHSGTLHNAHLGDGDGWKTQLFIARQHYFPIWGTCWESLAGGHHFRAWRQNGTEANSGAWFIGASKELDSSKHHTIVPNGYNLGRDWLVERAVTGGHWKGYWWKANVEWRSDLLEEGKKGVNHGITQDGRVAVLTVLRV